MRRELHVRAVRGRYPGRHLLRSDNIVASVSEIARVYRVRLDDDAHPDMWLELVLEVDSESEPKASLLEIEPPDLGTAFAEEWLADH